MPGFLKRLCKALRRGCDAAAQGVSRGNENDFFRCFHVEEFPAKVRKERVPQQY